MPKKALGKPGKDGLVHLTVRLRPEVYKALVEKSEPTKPMNFWVNELLDQFLDKAKIRLTDDPVPWDGEERRKGDRRKSG